MKQADKTFEEAFSRLEEIVQILEAGDTALEKTLSLYEEGSGLAKLCSGKLLEAEARVKKLLNDNGSLYTEPLE